MDFTQTCPFCGTEHEFRWDTKKFFEARDCSCGAWLQMAIDGTDEGMILDEAGDAGYDRQRVVIQSEVKIDIVTRPRLVCVPKKMI